LFVEARNLLQEILKKGIALLQEPDDDEDESGDDEGDSSSE
jgi:hypothetical protein